VTSPHLSHYFGSKKKDQRGAKPRKKRLTKPRVFGSPAEGCSGHLENTSKRPKGGGCQIEIALRVPLKKKDDAWTLLTNSLRPRAKKRGA